MPASPNSISVHLSAVPPASVANYKINARAPQQDAPRCKAGPPLEHSPPAYREEQTPRRQSREEITPLMLDKILSCTNRKPRMSPSTATAESYLEMTESEAHCHLLLFTRARNRYRTPTTARAERMKKKV